ncbi:hypothetical protein HYX13_04270 [Candidatus Woesearchaeota archaeon]|nr:hypothetical protein [Candidatus Woesearchaeota archaeon]
MATLLDIGLVQYFSVVFPFLFIVAVVYALLHKTKVVGDSVTFNAVISVVTAFAVVLSDSAVKLINFIIPWFAVVVVFLVLLLLVFQTMGLKEDQLPNVVKDKTVYWTLIGIAFVIIIAGFANVFGQSALEAQQSVGETTVTTTDGVTTTTPAFEQNIYAILFHPKILGMMILFTIAIFAVALLSAGPDK